jgi:hypothetical protein
MAAFPGGKTMPQYVFCLHGLPDERLYLGPQEFVDAEAARMEAEKSARELEPEGLGHDPDYSGCWYEVIDEQGYRVAVIPIDSGLAGRALGPGALALHSRHEHSLH